MTPEDQHHNLNHAINGYNKFKKDFWEEIEDDEPTDYKSLLEYGKKLVARADKSVDGKRIDPDAVKIERQLRKNLLEAIAFRTRTRDGR